MHIYFTVEYLYMLKKSYEIKFSKRGD